jgi:TonB family protein
MQLLSDKRNTPVPLTFLYSIIFHTVFFFLQPLEDKKSSKIVYLEITAQPPAVAPKKEMQKPKELPKKPVIKKLIQQQPLDTKPAPLVPPQVEEKPLTNSASTQSSANADANDVPIKFVPEAIVDKAARCQTPEIALTQDAVNAGVTSGKVSIEAQISADGKVTEAKILKGTGFQIDDSIIALAKKMYCIPAQKDGKNVAVVKRLQWSIQR